MDFSGPGFVLAIIAMCTTGWVITTFIRAKHGYPLENDWGGTVHKQNPDDDRALTLLSGQNEALKGQVLRLEERIAVLERIATDPADRTARAIDALR